MSDQRVGDEIVSQSVKRKIDDDSGQSKPSTSRDSNPTATEDVQPSTSIDESQLSSTILGSKWRSQAISLLVLVKSLPTLITKLCGKLTDCHESFVL